MLYKIFICTHSLGCLVTLSTEFARRFHFNPLCGGVNGGGGNGGGGGGGGKEKLMFIKIKNAVTAAVN